MCVTAFARCICNAKAINDVLVNGGSSCLSKVGLNTLETGGFVQCALGDYHIIGLCVLRMVIHGIIKVCLSLGSNVLLL